jgi:hypothetical protein
MGLTPGQKLDGTPISKVFIGSCTNGRIEDIREVAKIALGRKVAPGVHAMVVPGSGLVKQEAEAEGLHTILMAAGFDWREPGCSMCLAMNPDKLEPGQRCASTSNRNFEGRQGNGGRTHLMSPMMAAAAAITGTLTDIRNLPPVAAAAPAAAAAAPAGCMTPFIDLTGKVAALDMMNVDTDMIIPKNYLKTIKRTGLGVALFSDMRYNDNDLSNEKPDFVLNKVRDDDDKHSGNIQSTFREHSVNMAEELDRLSISSFGPVGCGRPLMGARRQRHTTAHNPSYRLCLLLHRSIFRKHSVNIEHGGAGGPLYYKPVWPSGLWATSQGGKTSKAYNRTRPFIEALFITPSVREARLGDQLCEGPC